MYWINIGEFIIGGLNIGLAVLVWLRNPSHRINQTFALAALSVGLWAGGEAFFREAGTSSSALFWAKLENVFGSLIALFFFFFTHYFPYERRKLRRVEIIFAAASWALLAYVILFSNWFITGITLNPPKNNFSSHLYGRAYLGLFFCFYIITAYISLLKKYFYSDGILKRNIRTIILGTGMLGSLGTFFGIIIPLVTGSDNDWFVLYFSIPMIIILTWFTLFNDKKISFR